MEQKIQELLMEIAETIAGELPIADVIASQLRSDYDTLYNKAGAPYGDSLEGLYQYILNTKVIIGED